MGFYFFCNWHKIFVIVTKNEERVVMILTYRYCKTTSRIIIILYAFTNTVNRLTPIPCRQRDVVSPCLMFFLDATFTRHQWRGALQ